MNMALKFDICRKHVADFRGVINGKAGKAAALPKFSLSQPEGADYAHPLALLA